jgi:phosphoglycolate phosphatase-like HAD superfamily hydrolase
VTSKLPDPDLVVFDIDGTLLATDDFWLGVGKSAVATVYARHGIDRRLPPDRRFLDAIGLPMDEFWLGVLPRDLHHLADEIESECQPLEEAAFAKGLGALYPGARALLVDLHAAGKAVALASNCGRRYLAGFIDAFDLGPILAAARCVDSPGIGSKADMLRDIRLVTGAGATLMVGDRSGDREAARENGVPFVLFAGGFYATPPEPTDVVIASYAELRELLLPVGDGSPA